MCGHECVLSSRARVQCSLDRAGLADEALSALEAKAAQASAQAAELAELRGALAQRKEQLAEHAAEAERLTLEVQASLKTSLCEACGIPSACLCLVCGSAPSFRALGYHACCLQHAVPLSSRYHKLTRTAQALCACPSLNTSTLPTVLLSFSGGTALLLNPSACAQSVQGRKAGEREVAAAAQVAELAAALAGARTALEAQARCPTLARMNPIFRAADLEHRPAHGITGACRAATMYYKGLLAAAETAILASARLVHKQHRYRSVLLVYR